MYLIHSIYFAKLLGVQGETLVPLFGYTPTWFFHFFPLNNSAKS